MREASFLETLPTLPDSLLFPGGGRQLKTIDRDMSCPTHKTPAGHLTKNFKALQLGNPAHSGARGMAKSISTISMSQKLGFRGHKVSALW